MYRNCNFDMSDKRKIEFFKNKKLKSLKKNENFGKLKNEKKKKKTKKFFFGKI